MIRSVAAALLVLAAAIGPSAAEDLAFTLTNSTSSPVDQFYASPSDANDWEEDILGVDVLDAGATANVSIADGRTQCEYDLKFIFQDGEEVTDDGVNLCDTGAYTLSE